MDNEEYRAQRTASRDDRNEEIDDLDRLKDDGRIYTPEKKKQMSRVLAEYEARTEQLKKLRFGVVAGLKNEPTPRTTAPLLMRSAHYLGGTLNQILYFWLLRARARGQVPA